MYPPQICRLTRGIRMLQWKKTKQIQPVQNAAYRHEYKYEIDNLQAVILRGRLAEIMNMDTHIQGRNGYQVRSLYFDDFDNSCYYDNENGNDPREKFRIRIYNGSDARISLELKKKNMGKTFKQSCPISREQVEALIAGKMLPWEDDADPLMKKFCIWLQTRCARPRVIVNYERIPFTYPDDNVRVTLDMHITASARVEDFFSSDFRGRPVMPLNKHILEVKYDTFIPDYIFRAVQTNHLNRVTCSKYYLCRKFGGIV